MSIQCLMNLSSFTNYWWYNKTNLLFPEMPLNKLEQKKKRWEVVEKMLLYWYPECVSLPRYAVIFKRNRWAYKAKLPECWRLPCPIIERFPWPAGIGPESPQNDMLLSWSNWASSHLGDMSNYKGTHRAPTCQVSHCRMTNIMGANEEWPFLYHMYDFLFDRSKGEILGWGGNGLRLHIYTRNPINL